MGDFSNQPLESSLTAFDLVWMRIECMEVPTVFAGFRVGGAPAEGVAGDVANEVPSSISG